MKATIAWFGTLLGMLGLTSLCDACYPGYACSPVFHTPLRQAPSPCNMCGFYVACPDGAYIGPNYWLRPPGLPFNGMLPGPTGQTIEGGRPMPMPMPGMAMPQYGFQQPPGGQRPTAFPSHPYARSPRDFFMWRENMEEMTVRPRLVP